MSNKLSLNEVLAAVDLDGKEVWDEINDEQRKSIVLFTLNRYISNVKASTAVQEHYLLVGNERYNKNLFDIMSKHPKLAWQLACSCSHESKSIYRHEWLGVKKQKNKKEQFLLDMFPDAKASDIEVLAATITTKEIKDYCETLGWDKKQINAIKF